MNTPLEVMKAILDNGGPIKACVADHADGKNYQRRMITGVHFDSHKPFITGVGSRWPFAWLAESTILKTRPMPPPDEGWIHDWARYRAINGHGILLESSHPLEPNGYYWETANQDCTLARIGDGYDAIDWKNSLQERPPKTRPMTRMEILGVLTREGCVVRTPQSVGWVTWETTTFVYDAAEYAIINRQGKIIEGPYKFEVTE